MKLITKTALLADIQEAAEVSIPNLKPAVPAGNGSRVNDSFRESGTRNQLMENMG